MLASTLQRFIIKMGEHPGVEPGPDRPKRPVLPIHQCSLQYKLYLNAEYNSTVLVQMHIYKCCLFKHEDYGFEKR